MEYYKSLLGRLPFLEIVQLREQWFLHYYGDVGNSMSAKLLRLSLAHRIQELELDTEGRCNSIRKLAAESQKNYQPSGNGFAQRMKPGTRLLREYKGRTHEVLAVKYGLFVYEGQIYKSLSEVARKIVGKPRAGTTFFGLRGMKRRPIP